MVGKAKRVTGVRWDPLFIRWCLNLSRVSSKAYEIMRESGISLPTRRTLNDYTHWMSAKPGFSSEIDTFLQTEAKVEELEDWQKYVCRLCFFIFFFCVGFYTWYIWLTCFSSNLRVFIICDFTIQILLMLISIGLLF